VNGHVEPQPLALAAGRPNRLRLININADQRVLFELMRGDSVSSWRPVAKDGADLPARQSAVRRAALLTGPGETADFEIVPQPGERLTLVISGPYATIPWRKPMHLMVR
jgi:hypothetical protein